MNGNRFTQIYTLSSHLSPFLNPALPSPEGPRVQGLDYHGRRRASSRGGDFLELIPSPGAGLGVCMGAFPARGNRDGPDFPAALFCASIDPLRREIRYLNAGHEPALLLRKGEDHAIRLENTGAALGLTHSLSYVQQAIPLEPGDLLAVFSAGVAETFDIHGRPFGSTGVLAILRRFRCAGAADLVEEILGAAERHAGWSEQSMDQTVAVIRFTGVMEEAIAEAETELSFAAA